MTLDETHSLEERNKYSELKLGCLNSFINAVGLSLNEGFLSGMLFLFVIIIKLTVIMKVQLSMQGQKSDQRHDKKCPNVLLINTDDMAWGDISINNPSKLLPTPNIDKLVSKGINFRDAHSCNAKCGPSRYCLLTGRYNFRSGHYNYRPTKLEYGRKIMSHLFKRNNYHTMVVGKMQPVGGIMTGNNETNAFFVDGARAWGFDQSFNSRNYCCFPGAGYFVNDQPLSQFDRWGVFSNFRYHGDVSISPEAEEKFYKHPKHYHLLDGYVSSYKAFRDTNQTDVYPENGRPWIRFVERPTGRVLVANLQINTYSDRLAGNFEFAVNGTTYATYKEADRARKAMIADCPKGDVCEMLKHTVPKRTQLNFDSRFITRRFHQTAVDYIEEHVRKRNPAMRKGEKRPTGRNQPFFMYLAFRGPHMPYSHEFTYNPDRPYEHMPYVSLGKPGEQIGLMDKFIGELMKKLHKLEIAENTLVMFTSDNGPDHTALRPFNRFGHIRTQMLRGLKGGLYEGSNRVPMLTWWPLGTHRALQGTNFDLPISQVDLFATFADILGYPLPNGDKCIYGFDSSTAPTHINPATLGRKSKPEELRFGAYMKSLSKNKISTQSMDSYTSTVQVSRDQNMELKVLGFNRTQHFKTHELNTGFLVGWDACIAEDSNSFAAAFNVKDESPPVQYDAKGKAYVEYERAMEQVSTMLVADMIGGVAIRFGRYKLMRFNAPKDLRTGYTNQHLGKTALHEGNEWLNADWSERCSYGQDGEPLNVGCTVEPLCRNHTTFGVTSCMRDYYYQLWDLEKNFGEKMSCAAVRNETDDFIDVMDHGIERGEIAKLNVGAVKKEGKPTDRWGIGIGIESTPVSNPKPFENDCCKVTQQGSCTIDEHNGPLAEGWAANAQRKHDPLRHKKHIPDGHIDEADFKTWTPFANCLKAVMELMEGQAKYPEAFETFEKDLGHGVVNLDQPATYDGPSVDGKQTDNMLGNMLHGQLIGSSTIASEYKDRLWKLINSEKRRRRFFHGGGSRYIDTPGYKPLVEECTKHLPRKMPKAYDIQPNFDVDMDKLGYYDTNDQTGGQNFRFEYRNGRMVDRRPIRKYYEEQNHSRLKSSKKKNYLFAFQPLY